MTIFQTILFILATLGIGGIILHWFPQTRLKIIFKTVGKEQIQKCDYVYIINCDRSITFSPIKNDQNEIYFINRYLRYSFNQEIGMFEAKQSEFFQPAQKNSQIVYNYSTTMKEGLEKEEVLKKRSIFGMCEMNIPKPNIFQYIFKEITSIYFILVYLSIFVWSAQGMFYQAFFFIWLVIGFMLINFFFLRQGINNIRKMVKINSQVQVLRSKYNSINQSQDNLLMNNSDIDSKYLVPGDIFFLQPNMRLPCDALLIEGTAVVNEGSLTGESLPIPKKPLEDDDRYFNLEDNRKSILFEGTTILKVKSLKQQNQILAIVLRTGFQTYKGQIFRAILYPKEVKYDFFKTVLKFFLILFIVENLLFIPFAYESHAQGFTIDTIIFIQYINMLLCCFPPVLMVFINFNSTAALIRLKQKKMVCTDTSKIIVSSQIETMCFDKTGTLTDNTVLIHGYYCINENRQKQPQYIHINDKQQEIIQDNEYLQIMHQLFACCHNLYKIDNQQELIGDQIDLAMYTYSKYKYIESKHPKILFEIRDKENNKQFEILKVFEFESHLQRMSVIVYDVKENKYYIYTKGAYEVIKKIIGKNQNLQFSNNLLDSLSLQGLRVLATSYKEIQANQMNFDREKLENDQLFLGLVGFENQLKSDTKFIIQELREANIINKVISGDNILTTIQTSRLATIIDNNLETVQLDINQEDNYLFYSIIPCDNEQDLITTNPNLIQNSQKCFYKKDFEEKICIDSIINFCNIILKLDKMKHYEYAISGKLVQFFYNNYLKDQIQKLDFKNQEQLSYIKNQTTKKSGQVNSVQMLILNIISKTKVFGRSLPTQKTMIIKIHQILKQKVAMIGDGANDCAAIKTADVGMSFGGTDAGYSAAFLNQGSQSLEIISDVFKISRCVSQNVIDTIKLYLLSNVFKQTVIYVSIYQASIYGDIQSVYSQFLNFFPCYLWITFGAPLKKISPLKINDNFLSKEILFSFYGLCILSGIGSIIVYRYTINQPDFTPTTLNEKHKGYNLDSDTNSTQWLTQSISQIFMYYAVIHSKPFKERVYKNYFLLIQLCLTFFYFCLMIFVPSTQIPGLNLKSDLMDDQNFRYSLLYIGIFIGILLYCYEEMLVKQFFGIYGRMKKQNLQ